MFVPHDFKEYPPEEMLRRARAFYEEMNRRRSVRHFADRPVSREIVEWAVRTAGTSPSGAHKQPWHFVLVGDPETQTRIREAAEAEERENYERRFPPAWIEDLAPLGTDWHKPFLTLCPWLLVVFARQYRKSEGGVARHYYVQESVGMAVGLLLAALHHAGLATLTHTPSPMGFLRNILGRPENERPYVLIALGHPESGCQVPDLERKPLEEILTISDLSP